MIKVAVILSGCGYLDGAEIRESVLSLLYLDQQGVETVIFAPDVAQYDVVDHMRGTQMEETRNVLVEAARIARGQIEPLSNLDATAFDALILPGGFGVAKSLSSFAQDGADADIHEEFASVVRAFLNAKKPIGAICIAPAVLAAIAKGVPSIAVTIGEDEGTASAIENTGAKHHISATQDIVIDEENRIVSCSAYMREDRIAHVAQGIETLIQGVVRMAQAS